jgi:hypothetical protein
MIGGTISGNNAVSCGGVCIVNNSTFTMSGASIISGNIASGYDAGVGIYSGSTFTMAGGTIKGNTATMSTGGVAITGGNSVFTMNGGTISGNTASIDWAGGVFVDGTFTMNGGIIGGSTKDDGNKAKRGGGVFLGSGTFTMTNGTIQGNTAATNGGGVFVESGTFTMTGGMISKNTATNVGGGVFVSTSGSFTKTGASTITGYGNDKDNGNRVMNNNNSHAAYKEYIYYILPWSTITVVRYKNNTSGPSNNLDGSNKSNWDYSYN